MSEASRLLCGRLTQTCSTRRSVAGRPDAAIVVIHYPNDDFYRYRR
jgi:hypothetical protein